MLNRYVAAGLALSLCWSARVFAQADAQVADLNSQGLEAYQGLDMDTARAKLEEALGLAQQAGLVGPVVAQVFMNLAVVQISGLNDRDQGLGAFVSAVCMQPDVQLDPLLSTPDVQQAFAQAQQDAAAGACGPSTAPPQLMPTAPPMSGPQVVDRECPPGVVCGGFEGEEGTGPKDFARFFFGLQLVGGFAYVTSGLEADAKPPLGQVLTGYFYDTNYDGFTERVDGIDATTGMKLEPVLDGDGNVIADPDDDVTDNLPDFNGDGMPDQIDFDGDGTFDNRYYFNEGSAWVPDKDSFDDVETFQLDDAGNAQVDPMTGKPIIAVPRGLTPVPGTCAADGKSSGPLDLSDPDDPDGAAFAQYEPTKYCVRVEKPGVVTNLALRLNPGYFITKGFALSAPLRIQFDSGKGTMSNMLLGLRGEVLVHSIEGATGVPVSIFFGLTYGQIQAKPPAQGGAAGPAPYVTSGPFGGHLGMSARLRFHRNFGIVISPELDVQFPGVLFNFDLAAGPEVAF